MADYYAQSTPAESLQEAVDADYTPIPEAWTIDSEGAADWALRKLGELAHRREHVEGLAQIERLQIEHWRRDENERIDRDVAFFTGHLHGFMDRHVPDVKTFRLPHGTLMLRAQQPEWFFTTDFIEWAINTNPDLLRVKYEPDRAVIKEAIPIDLSQAQPGDVITPSLDGEIVPGVSVVKRGPRFSTSLTDG